MMGVGTIGVGSRHGQSESDTWLFMEIFRRTPHFVLSEYMGASLRLSNAQELVAAFKAKAGRATEGRKRRII